VIVTPNIDEAVQKGVVMALRQVEILSSQAELARFHLVELARQVGIQLIDQTQAPQSTQPKPPENPAEKKP
jgi:hypothetical protein